MTDDPRQIVIVGAGLAGDRCAFALRGAGFTGRLTLVGDEAVRPYDRPPLSKAVLKGEGAEDRIYYRTEKDYAAADIDLRLGQGAVAIDRDARRLALADGTSLSYDVLVLATGSRLRELPALPRGTPGVFYLRDRADALALRAALQAGGRVAVIGGGVIGLEAAAAAIGRGLPVTVIEPAPRIMARACGAAIAGLLGERHRRAGADLRCGVGIASVRPTVAGHRLDLTDGTSIEAEIVIVGIGVVPATALAGAAGLAVTPAGIAVDGHGRTSDPAIFAAGEVTFHYNGLSDGHERQENWFHAAAHGEHVGRAIVDPAAPYAQLSGFWTDQYDLSLQSVGRPLAERDVIRGAIGSGTFVAFHLDGDVLVGASGQNAASELRQAKALIRSRVAVDADRLADPSIKVSDATARVKQP